MTTLNQLTDHLSQLTDSLKQTNDLITRLAKLSFQPGSEPLEPNANSSSNVRIELAQDIHDSLKQLEEDLELLKQEVEDNAGSDYGRAVSRGGYRRRSSLLNNDSEQHREQARLNAQVTRLEEDLRSSRSKFRRAQLTAKKASEAAKRKERELVFASLRDPPPAQKEQLSNGTGTPTNDRDILFASRRPKSAQQKNLTKEDLELDASTSVTAALRRTHTLLSTELSRSRFAQETFDQSTAALADLGEKYTDIGSILGKSGELVGTLLRSQKSDTWYLETAFYILIATLCWLVFRRLLFLPFIKAPWFLFKWFLLKPFVGFCTLTGIIATESASAATKGVGVTSSRTPLIVQPSATGGFPKFKSGMADDMQKKGGVPVGNGGANAKVGRGEASRHADGEQEGLSGQMSEQIGQMAEQSAQQDRQSEQDDRPKRADGTVLEDRGDKPRNPKKKMFETDVENAKYEAQQRQEQERRERDEL